MRITEMGGTVVILPKFDPAAALATIEAHRVTHSQWVPTMFSRLLALPKEVRARHDLSSHQVALHAAAPCPEAVKRAMIAWWGPIVHEYYGGTGNAGVTFLRADARRARTGARCPAPCGAHPLHAQGRRPPGTETRRHAP